MNKTSDNKTTEQSVEEHVAALLALGWEFRGRGLYPGWRAPQNPTDRHDGLF